MRHHLCWKLRAEPRLQPPRDAARAPCHSEDALVPRQAVVVIVEHLPRAEAHHNAGGPIAEDAEKHLRIAVAAEVLRASLTPRVVRDSETQNVEVTPIAHAVLLRRDDESGDVVAGVGGALGAEDVLAAAAVMATPEQCELSAAALAVAAQVVLHPVRSI